jgi:hypothetical protein
LKSIKDAPHVHCSQQFPVVFVVRNARQPVSRSSFEILKASGLVIKLYHLYILNFLLEAQPNKKIYSNVSS